MIRNDRKQFPVATVLANAQTALLLLPPGFGITDGGTMVTAARVSQLSEIEPLREEYREEMNCQIVHDSIHRRPGWTREYALELDGATVGYGSVAIAGPWRDTPALYEFYVQREQRMQTFDLFASLLGACRSEEHTSELQSLRHLVCRFLIDAAITEIYTLSLHDALPIYTPALYEFYVQREQRMQTFDLFASLLGAC